MSQVGQKQSFPIGFETVPLVAHNANLKFGFFVSLLTGDMLDAELEAA